MSDEYRLSEADEHILELNNAGHSTRVISKILKQKYGIELGRTAVNRHLMELRQDEENDVQVHHRIAERPKEQNRWYKIMQRLKEAIDEYVKLHKSKPASRTMYYQLLDEKLLTDSISDQTQFKRASVDARLGTTDSNDVLRYPKLEIDCFADDDSRLTSNNYEDHDPTAPTDPGPIEDPDDYIDEAIETLKSAVGDYDGVGTLVSPGESGGHWWDQPEYVEVWQEKNELQPEFEKILEDKHITIRSNKGFSSLIFLHMCTQALKETMERKKLEPENIHILYCGDWDPSGEHIDWYLNKRLRRLGISGIDFQRIAVTPEQIDKYKLPLMSIKQKPGNEAPDPNMKEFVRRYGNKATHLNAFFTKKHFKTFKKLLRDSVDDHFDQDIYDRMVEEYAVQADPPEHYSVDELKRIHRDMFRKITGSFYPGWEEEIAADIEYDEEEEDEDEDTEDEGNEDGEQ
jgi:hypothetical protein